MREMVLVAVAVLAVGVCLSFGLLFWEDAGLKATADKAAEYYAKQLLPYRQGDLVGLDDGCMLYVVRVSFQESNGVKWPVYHLGFRNGWELASIGGNANGGNAKGMTLLFGNREDDWPGRKE